MNNSSTWNKEEICTVYIGNMELSLSVRENEKYLLKKIKKIYDFEFCIYKKWKYNVPTKQLPPMKQVRPT